MSNLISVIVPCYKQAQFLDETLQSVLNQTYSNWECIIVDDGSPDNTQQIAHNWVAKDSRFIYLKKENGGLSSARNKGLEIAKGDFIQFLDSDDLLDSKKFAESIDLIEKENADVVITNFLRFRKSLNHLKKAFCNLEDKIFTFESILLYWDVTYSIPIHCGIFSSRFLSNIRFNENLKAKEDWMFWIDYFRNNPKVSFVNQNLVFYRMHHQGMTKDSKLMDENLHKAYELIFNSLDEKNKQLFFKRLMSELSHSKREHKEFKDSIFYRKLFYGFKNLFKFR